MTDPKIDKDIMEKAEKINHAIFYDAEDKHTVERLAQAMQQIRDDAYDEQEKPIWVHQDTFERIKKELTEERELADKLANSEPCPNIACKDTGQYPEHDPSDPHDDGCSRCPIPVQCEFCWTNPKSSFNALSLWHKRRGK